MFAAVAAGGALGAAARFGLAQAWPAATHGFPYATFVTNVAGCAALGGLLQLLADRPMSHRAHRLLRPFLGTGLLGGFTTFSTYAVEAVDLARAGRPVLAGGYVVGTLITAFAAVWVGARAVRGWDRPR